MSGLNTSCIYKYIRKGEEFGIHVKMLVYKDMIAGRIEYQDSGIFTITSVTL